MKNNIFQLNNVDKHYKLHAKYFSSNTQALTALSHISCAIPIHSTFGIVGESGSGKSTLMRLLLGMEKPSSGTIVYNNDYAIEQLNKNTLRMHQSQVKMIFQDPARSLNHRLSVEKILFGSLVYSPSFRKECKLLGLVQKKVIENEIYERITQTLRTVGLNESVLNRYPTEFSGGQRQRIAIVRALIHRPEVLICDEITSALDMSTRKSIIELLMTYKRQHNMTIIFVSHDLSLVLYLCDHVMVLNKGAIQELASADEVLTNPQSRVTKQLLNVIPTFPQAIR